MKWTSLSVSKTTLAIVMMSAAALPLRGAHAQSLSAKDVQIIGKALGFVDPPTSSGVVAVVFDPTNAASKQDADAIVAAFGGGITGSSSNFTAKSISSTDFGGGDGYVAVIAAQGAASDGIMAAAKAHKMLCITADTAAIQGGKCIMSVSSDPAVKITVSDSAARAAGVAFNPAFHMLISEI
jgi:hypothetical protein